MCKHGNRAYCVLCPAVREPCYADPPPGALGIAGSCRHGNKKGFCLDCGDTPPQQAEPQTEPTQQDKQTDPTQKDTPTQQDKQTEPKTKPGRNAAKKRAASGYYDISRKLYRKDFAGSDLKSARSVRLCLEKAVENAAPFLGVKFDSDLYKITPINVDTRFAAIKRYLESRGIAFINRSQEFFVKGGPEVALLKQRTGLFVVHIGFTAGNDDKQPDHHSVFYNAELGRIIDSDPAVKIRCFTIIDIHKSIAIIKGSSRRPTAIQARSTLVPCGSLLHRGTRSRQRYTTCSSCRSSAVPPTSINASDARLE